MDIPCPSQTETAFNPDGNPPHLRLSKSLFDKPEKSSLSSKISSKRFVKLSYWLTGLMKLIR
jgi:hypothetical protein